VKKWLNHQDSKPPRVEGYSMNFVSISKDMDDIATKIVDAAYQVHSNLGPGLLEKVYEACFCHELSKKNVSFKRQVELPIEYDVIFPSFCGQLVKLIFYSLVQTEQDFYNQDTNAS